MKSLIPVKTENGIEDGQFIHALQFCCKNCNTGKCAEFYNSIHQYNCFLTCPYGMSVFPAKSGDAIRLFTCMRDKKTYKKEKTKQIAQTNGVILYNPVLEGERLIDLIQFSMDNFAESVKLTEKQASIDSISHEVKKLNSQIKDRSDILLQSFGQNDDSQQISPQEIQALLEKIRTIYVCSSMVNARFALLDYEKNPQTLQQGAKYDCNIYKKFDKMKIIFSNYLGRKVQLGIYGRSYRCIDAYPSFEMIPLLIVDNAVKYSYHNQEVSITFTEDGDKLIVDVESYSPYCSKDEIDNIFQKGFRGKNAIRVADGSGIGLFFTKMLCDLHSVELNVISDNSRLTEVNGVAYAPFTISLTFPNTYET